MDGLVGCGIINNMRQFLSTLNINTVVDELLHNEWSTDEDC